MTCPAERLYEEATYLAYYLHWPLDDILDLEGPVRRRFLEETARINRRVSRGE